MDQPQYALPRDPGAADFTINGRAPPSDGQFFRSAKRGDAAAEINARYGHDPGLSLYTHLSDQHGPYSVKVMSATHHEAPYVLDGLLHHGTLLRIDTHYLYCRCRDSPT